MGSKEYWEQREAEALKHYVTDEKEYKKQLDQIYQDMLDGVQNEIYSFYGKYATKEGITIAEAKKRVAEVDIKAYERKARKYVKDAAKDRRANFGKTDTEAYYFSDEANEEMRLYNLAMKVNRLEMLKANIGLELIEGHSKLEKFMSEILQGRTEKELRRQAGILGKTIQNNAQMAKVIVNASFHNATFSQRLWMYNDAMKADLSKMIQTGLIQGKNPRVLAKELEKYFIGEEQLKNGKRGAKYHAETLMITELARVQIDAQKESFIRNGFTKYTFHANSGCCPICSKLNGRHFDIEDMMPAKNAPPMHPRCRCSVSAYEDSDEYEEWLDYLDKGGTTDEWNRLKKSGKNIENSAENDTIKSGAISGARNPYGEKAKEHAIKYYGLVRSMKTDVKKIAKTTEMPEADIQAIKDFIFYDKHDLGGEEPEYFEPDYMMAESWRRLIAGTPEKHDLTLIYHEDMERKLMKQGMSQNEAHIATTKKYNYDKEANEFYDKIEKYSD
mgnify:CR=1 FL=1